MKKYEFESKLDKNSSARLRDSLPKKNTNIGCIFIVLIFGGLIILSNYSSSSSSKNTTSINNNEGDISVGMYSCSRVHDSKLSNLKPDANLERKITNLNNEIDDLESYLNLNRNTNNINFYNQRVNEYNNLIEELKDIQNKYNGQVDEYNRYLSNNCRKKWNQYFITTINLAKIFM